MAKVFRVFVAEKKYVLSTREMFQVFADIYGIQPRKDHLVVLSYVQVIVLMGKARHPEDSPG